MFFTFFNAANKFDDMLWMIDDQFAYQTIDQGEEKSHVLKILNLCCIAITAVLGIIYLP